MTILSVDLWQLRYLDDLYQGRIITVASSQSMIQYYLERADLVVGAAYLPGARTPRLIKTSMVKDMKEGSVIVDVSVDQGGCAETTRPTTHTDPVFPVEGVLHYGVSNIPGIVPHTSTFALTNATLPFIVQLVEGGVQETLKSNPGLRKGVNVYQGRLTSQAVANAHGLPFEALSPSEI